MDTTYVITNDRYSQQPDETTFTELVEMCQDNDWDANLREWGENILNLRGEVVAVKKSAYEASMGRTS